MKKSVFAKIVEFKFTEFILLVINSYLLGIISWQVVHKKVDVMPFFTTNIEPGINNPFLSVKFFILIFVVLAIIGFFIKLIGNHSKSNVKMHLVILGALIVGINLDSIVANISLFNVSFFGLTLKMFFNETWYWKNLIFVWAAVYLFVFYFVMPLGRRFKLKITSNVWIYVLIVIAIVAYSLLSIGKHQNLRSNTMDLGGYDQAIWKFSQFEAPLSTIYADDISNGDVNIKEYDSQSIKQFFPNMLGDHFEPVLAMLAPIYWIVNDVKFLLFIQALFVCLGAWPIYMLAKDKLKSNFAGLAIAASYLFFIGIQTAMEFDFHPLIFLAPILAYIIYFLENKKYLWVYIFMALALLTKEVASLYIFFIGIYALLIKKDRKVGLIMMGSGIFWYILVINIIIPYGFHRHYGHIGAYDALGDSASGILKTMITNPIYVINILFNPGNKVNTWLSIFGSTGFLAALSPATLIMALPMFGEKFLTMSKSSCWTVWWHYTATITPIIMISAIYGIKYIKDKYEHIEFNWAIFGSLVVVVSTFTVAFINHNDPSLRAPLARILSPKYYEQRQDVKDFHEIKKLIPDDATLAAQDNLLPQLAHREQVYRIHPTIPDVDYVVIDTYEGYWPWTKEDIIRIIGEMRRDPDYKMIENKGEVYLFERTSNN